MATVDTPDTRSRPITIPIIGSRIPRTMAEIPSSYTLITREEIDRRQPADTVDLLRQLPGIHVDQVGGRGGVSSVYTRGADPNFTLVLIDGVKVNDPTNSRGGSFDFSTLDINQIETIEILPGPLSVVYGSDAMAGVINIVTRKGQKQTRQRLEAQAGTQGLYQGNAETSGSRDNTSYAAYVSTEREGESVEGNQFNGSNFSASSDSVLATDTRLQLSTRYNSTHSRSFPDDSGGPSFAVIDATDKRDRHEWSFAANLSGEVSRRLTGSVKLSWFDQHENFDSPGVAPGVRDPFGIPPNSSDSDFQRSAVVANTVFQPTKKLKLSIGGEAQFEDGSSDSKIALGDFVLPGRFSLDRNTYAPFAEAVVTLPAGILLQAGIRRDFVSDFKSKTSTRLGLSYAIENSGTTLSAIWGEGFKLPSFFSLANPVVGNPDLLPETSKSLEVGITQSLWNSEGRISLSYFDNRFYDLIDFDEGPPPQLVNRSKVTTEGLDLSLSLSPARTLDLQSTVTYLQTNIAGSDQELRNRPDWRGGVSATWTPRSSLSLGVALTYVDDVLDSSVPTGDVKLDSYWRTDLVSSWKVRQDVRLTLAIDNLLDENYQEAVGFPAAGIRPRIGAILDF